ncbi:MAG: hypothetical protein ACI9TH_004392, partial [Kiritimatiellia bacterium]
MLGLNQFADGLDTGIDEVVRATGGIADAGAAEIDAEVVIQGREDFLEFDRPFDGFAPVFVGGTDDLSITHAAAKQQTGVGARPVIAAVVGIELWGTTELPPDDHGDILV